MMLLAPKTKTRKPADSKVLDTEIGTIYIMDNMIVMEAKPNVNITIRNGMFILLKVVKLCANRPMVYISNRVNSYSVDPNDYKFLEMIPNLKGIAVVTYCPRRKQAALLEERFFRKPFKTFGTLVEAKTWAEDVIEGRVIV